MKNQFSKVLLLALFLGLFTGCSGDNANETKKPNDKDNTALDTAAKGIELLTGSFSKRLPINNICTDNAQKEKFIQIPLLNLTLKKLGVSSEQISDIICKNTNAYSIENIVPTNSDGVDGVEKFEFFLKQKSGCSFSAVVEKEGNDTVINFNEKKKCK